MKNIRQTTNDPYLHASFLADERRFVTYNLIDALSENPNFSPEKTDIVTANEKLQGIINQKGRVNYKKLQKVVHELYLNEDWFLQNGLDQAWQVLKDIIATQDFSNRKYMATYYWLADQLRLLASDVLAIPQWFDNGVDGGEVFGIIYQSREADENTPVVFIAGGAGSEPFHYSEAALEIAKKQDGKKCMRVAVISDPAGEFSSGLIHANGKRNHGRGDYVENSVQTMGQIWNSITQQVLGDPQSAPQFQMMGHSAGLFAVKSLIKYMQENDSPYLQNFCGKIDFATPYKLAEDLEESKKMLNRLVGLLPHNGDNLSLNVPMLGKKSFFESLTSEDTLNTYKYQMLWGGGGIRLNTQQLLGMQGFGHDTGNFYRELSGLQIDAPHAFFISINDLFTDPMGVQNTLRWIGPEQSLKMYVFGASQDGIPKIFDNEKQNELIKNLSLLDYREDRLQVEWIDEAAAGHALSTKAVYIKFAEVLSDNFSE